MHVKTLTSKMLQRKAGDNFHVPATNCIELASIGNKRDSHVVTLLISANERDGLYRKQMRDFRAKKAT